MRFPIVVDGRNLYKPGHMFEHGFSYLSIGRPAVDRIPVEHRAEADIGSAELADAVLPVGVGATIRRRGLPCVVSVNNSLGGVSMARILITGAAGFLGSHLTDRLLGEGHTIFGVDNLPPAARAT